MVQTTFRRSLKAKHSSLIWPGRCLDQNQLRCSFSSTRSCLYKISLRRSYVFSLVAISPVLHHLCCTTCPDRVSACTNHAGVGRGHNMVQPHILYSNGTLMYKIKEMLSRSTPQSPRRQNVFQRTFRWSRIRTVLVRLYRQSWIESMGRLKHYGTRPHLCSMHLITCWKIVKVFFCKLNELEDRVDETKWVFRKALFLWYPGRARHPLLTYW